VTVDHPDGQTLPGAVSPADDGETVSAGSEALRHAVERELATARRTALESRRESGRLRARIERQQEDLRSARTSLQRLRSRTEVRGGEWLRRLLVRRSRPAATGPDVAAVSPAIAPQRGADLIAAATGADPAIAAAVEGVAAKADPTRFVDAWAPRIYRSTLLDLLAGGRAWRAEPLRIRLVAGPGRRSPDLAALAAGLGWIVVDERADVEIAADPTATPESLDPSPVRVAWAVGEVEGWLACPWLPDADVVVAGDAAGAAAIAQLLGAEPLSAVGAADAAALGAVLRDGLLAWAERPHIGILLETPGWVSALAGGDLPFARDLQQAFARRGRPARVRLRPAWALPVAARDDVSIQLAGREHVPAREGQITVLWRISHPDDADPDLERDVDLAFAASPSFAAWMTSRTGREVRPLLQAAAPARMTPVGDAPAHELLFMANGRSTGRPIIEDLLPTDHELAVYGTNWKPEALEARHHRGENVTAQRVAAYYAAADIVLNDHWVDMRREGMLSNRLFDASAAGAFIISDDVAGIEEVFDGGVAVYRDAADLRRLVDHYLAHPEERRAMAARAHAAVLRQHTFDHRVEELLAALAPLEAGRPLTADAPGSPRPS